MMQFFARDSNLDERLGQRSSSQTQAKTTLYQHITLLVCFIVRDPNRKPNPPPPKAYVEEPINVINLIGQSNFPWVIRLSRRQPLTPTEHFWVACAHVRLGHPLPAIEHLTHAKLEGFETAAAMLGLVYQTHQETKTAQFTLEGIKTEALNTTGQMLYQQLRAALAHQNNDHEQAQAILLAQPHALEPQHRIFRPGLAKLALLIAAETPGGDQPWMLELLDHLDPIHPGITSTSPEQHDQLDAIFENTKLEHLNFMLRAHIHLIRAHHRHCRSRHEDSIKDLEQVIALTVGHRQTELQFHAQLGFARVFMHPSYPINRTREHLEQAQSLARNNDGRQAQLQLGMARWHTYNRHQDVFDTLQAAQTAAQNLQHHHDNAISHLHLCEAMLQYDQPEKADRALEAARLNLGRLDQANISLELEHLPLSSKLLSARPSQIDPNETGEVLLKTLGAAQIQHNARHVKLNIGLSRTLAILTYLLEHPNADLSEIQLAVFDGTNSQFRSYLHQSRYELQRHIPGLSLPYDRASRTYSIQTNNLRLRWDAQELLRTLRELNHEELLKKLEDYKGPFLNTLDTPWTEEVRHKIETHLTQQGIIALQQLHAQGRTELCLQLAERLITIQPFLSEIIAIQLQATFELYGEEASKRLQLEISRQLKAQFGGIPEDFQTLLRTALS